MSPRIPLGDLEQATRDPAGYRAQIGTASNRGFRYGYFNGLRNAIRRFHDGRDDAVQARIYLEDNLADFRDASKRTETIDRFAWYIEEYQSRRGWVTTEVMRRITLNLPEWTPADLVISGEISRMDIVPTGGYAVWLFRNNDVQGWRRELRMPLIQETLAHEMGAPLDDVMVGVYGFRQRVVEQKTYSVGEVRLAYSSLGDLLRQLGF